VTHPADDLPTSGRDALRRTYLVYFAFLGTMGPYLSLYFQEGLGFGEATSGRVMATVMLSALVGGFLTARVADSLRVRRRLQRGLSLCAMGACLTWLVVDTPASATVTAIAMGLCIGPQIPMLDAVTVDGLGANHRMYGRIRIFGTLGWGGGAVVVGVMLDVTSAAIVIPLAMGGWLILFHLCTWTVPDTQPRRTASEAIDIPPLRLFSIPLVILLLVTYLHAAAFGNYEAFSAKTFQSMGMVPLQVSAILLVGITAEAWVFYATPTLLLRHTAKNMALVAFVVSGVRWAVMPSVSTFSIFMLLQLTHACTFGLWYAAAIHLVGILVPAGLRTTGQIALSMAGGAGMATGAALGGFIRETHGMPEAFYAGAAAEGVAAVLLVSVGRRMAGRC
jgi:PPP family 3-phenylpropionic acid transporter